MYHKVVAALLVLLAVPCCFAQNAAKPATEAQDSTAVEKQITATLHSMYEAEKRHDIDFILARMSDDFAEVAGDGRVYHKADIAPGIRDMVLRDYSISDCHFNLLTPNSAYHTCEMRVSAEFKGNPIPAHFRVTWLWTRADTGWLLRFEQGTVIPEPAKTDSSK